MSKAKSTIAGVLVGLLTLTVSALPAHGVVESDDPGWTVGIVGVDGRTSFADIEGLMSESSHDGGVAPMLIDDPVAWAACFGPTLNPSHALASWASIAPSDLTVALTCGPSDTRSFGWHHIQTNHQAEWQTRVDQVVAVGGPNIAWDDYMAEASGLVLTQGRFTAEYDGKRCYADTVGVYAPGESVPRLTFNPSVVASMTNSVVITSVPTSAEDCSRRAPFES